MLFFGGGRGSERAVLLQSFVRAERAVLLTPPKKNTAAICCSLWASLKRETADGRENRRRNISIVHDGYM